MLFKLVITVLCGATSGIVITFPENQNQTSLLECAFEILHNSKEPNSVLIYNDFPDHMQNQLKRFNSTLALLNLKGDIPFPLNSVRYDLHLILINHLNEFNRIISILFGNHIWNPTKKFLVVYFGAADVTVIFEESLKKYIINIDVVQLLEGVPGVYTYYPFEERRCVDKIVKRLIGSDCSVGRYFPEKIPEKPENCVLRAVGNTYPPFVKNPYESSDDAGVGGFEVSIVSLFADRMGLNRKNIATRSAFGIKLPNGSYTGVLKLLAEGECDIVYGHLVPNRSNVNDLDSTVYYFQDPNAWHVPAARQGKRWESLILIFEPILWVSIGVVLVFNVVAWWVFGLHSKDLKEFRKFVWCGLNCWYCLLLGSIKMPFRFRLRLLVIFWTYFSLILATLYQSKLVSILLKPVYEHQISTKEELLESSLNLIIINDFVLGFKSTGRKIDLDLLEKSTELPYKEYIEIKNNFSEGYAFIGSVINTKYLMFPNYTLPNGDPKLYIFKNVEFMNALCMYFRKGYPFLDKFNNLVLLAYSNGLMAKWVADSMMFTPQTPSNEPEKFDIENLIGAFYLLIIGWVVSGLVFLGEVIVNKIKIYKFSKNNRIL